MITKEQFIKSIELVQQFDNTIDRLYDENIDLTNSSLYNNFGLIVDYLWDTNFTDEGVDWINWWLYERISITTGKELKAYDENDNEIDVSSPDKLWDLVVEYLIK